MSDGPSPGIISAAQQLVCHCGTPTCLTASSSCTAQAQLGRPSTVLLMVTALTANPQVESLAKPQHRFKVDVNAGENHMTGAAVITDDFCLVIVEGGKRATTCIQKDLMCMAESHSDHRIVGMMGAAVTA